MISILHHIIDPLRDFIFPPVCLTCTTYLEDHKVRICPECWKSFTPVTASYPVWIELKSKFETGGVVQDLFARYLFEKEGMLQEVIHLLKYQGMKSIGVRLGSEIGTRLKSISQFSTADILVPIPLHKLKRRERGYNQSEYICKGISEEMGIPVNSSLIERKKYTQSQTKLNMQERRENVGDAFNINPKYESIVNGNTFILVDDVITTGSTINACAVELLAHKAKSILAVSVALAE